MSLPIQDILEICVQITCDPCKMGIYI